LSDIDNGANLLTIPFGHAVDALCWVLGELKDISSILVNHRPELQVVDDGGKPTRISHKTAHDYITVNARLIESGGVADITYAPGNSLTGKGFYWEITGTEGSLVLEGPMGHVQIAPPTLKMATTAEPELKLVPLPRASDATYTIGKAWDAFAGVGLDEGHTVTTFEDALVRHEMIDAIYRSAESGRRENYV
jgi:predicted dehydrogenase